MSSSRRARTSIRTSATGGSWGARGRWPPLRGAAACSPPPRETRPLRSRRSTARSPSSTPIRTRSSADGRCSASAPRADRRSRSSAARGALEQALAIFEELGARLWAEKARAELARISGRAPASEELTEAERRVAELAAQGRTNKQIAAELFMGVSTVEAHLSHVYRKLGVRRAELAIRLAMSVDEAIEA